MKRLEHAGLAALFSLMIGFAGGCSGSNHDDVTTATVRLRNDLAVPDAAPQVWTVCRSSFLGVDFGTIDARGNSPPRTVEPGLDYVLTIAALNDPQCDATNALPLASVRQEGVVDGQSRTIAINAGGYQSPCASGTTGPMAKPAYDRIVALWPEYGFLPYDRLGENAACLK